MHYLSVQKYVSTSSNRLCALYFLLKIEYLHLSNRLTCTASKLRAYHQKQHETLHSYINKGTLEWRSHAISTVSCCWTIGFTLQCVCYVHNYIPGSLCLSLLRYSKMKHILKYIENTFNVHNVVILLKIHRRTDTLCSWKRTQYLYFAGRVWYAM